ncbi:MAG TPA: PIG-L family deacetylase [Patescibacteria group bacterium]
MKSVVAVFAHPDDEAFGPSGTLALLAKERPVYLICVTDGSAGMNSSAKTHALTLIRKEELLASAKILGIKEVFFLNYKDGTLSNNLYHEVAEKVQKIVEELKPEVLITYESRGVSGHLDHIAVSFIITYVFEHSNVSELWYYCITQKRREAFKDYFIYFPPGYAKEKIDKVVDVSGIWEQKLQAMHQHESQMHDVERILAGYKELPKEENFIIRKRV